MKLFKQLHLVSYRSLLIIGLLLVAAVMSCQRELNFDKVPEQDHNLVLQFKPVVQYDSVPLVFGQTYTNFFKEKYTATGFKFYIHNIQLINTDSGRVFRLSTDKYYLVDFSDSTTTTINMGVLPYTYNRIAFTIGVDSTSSVRGPRTGALDPAKGMFWNDSTGYIMAKLEGTSSASGQGKFEYDIGGFTGEDNVIKTITLLFPYAQNIVLLPGQTTKMFITADANDWFYNPHDIKIAVNPVISAPGDLATQVAENYSKMFTVDSIANQ
jgi:hypothetical protein